MFRTCKVGYARAFSSGFNVLGFRVRVRGKVKIRVQVKVGIRVKGLWFSV